MTYTQTQLTELAEQNPDELVRMIADICYGWTVKVDKCDEAEFIYYADSGGKFVCAVEVFNPLAKTESGRSQAFELAEKFDCFPKKNHLGSWQVISSITGLGLSIHKDPQTAICIATILAAQELRK